MLIHRNERLLVKAINEISDTKADRLLHMNVQTTDDLVDALELNNMLLSGEMLAKACLMRKESRGGHYREDYPNCDDINWQQVIKVSQKNGKMCLDTEVLDPEWKDKQGDMAGKKWG